MNDPFFFGYGSLVNTGTHAYERTSPARLSGWKRVWRHTTMRELAYLSVRPDPKSEIRGLIAHVPGNDWAALDERERGYTREKVNSEASKHSENPQLDLQIYQTRADCDAAPCERHPVLMSYLDVVFQGYLAIFGEVGVREFIETTDGWDIPILNDRASPLYPRHQVLEPAESDLVDAYLAELPAEIKQL